MLNKLLLVLFILVGCSTVTVHAQRQHRYSQDSVVTQEIGTDVYRYSKMSEVIQTNGKAFNSGELQNMAAKNVNQVANTVSGVQARAGEPVIIRGCANGTAYFVDGVRVYGALPFLTW